MTTIPPNIEALIQDEARRIAALFGPDAKPATFLFRGDASGPEYAVYCSVKPSEWGMEQSEFAPTFAECVEKMEALAIVYGQTHREMVAGDIFGEAVDG